MDAQLGGKLGYILCQYLFIGDAGIVQHLNGNTAVRTGGGGEKERFVAICAAFFLCYGSGGLGGIGLGALFNIILLASLVLLRFTDIPVLHRAVVAGNAAVNLGGCAALRAGEMLTGEITVGLADGIGGGHGVVGQAVVFRNLAYQGGSRLPRGELLA